MQMEGLMRQYTCCHAVTSVVAVLVVSSLYVSNACAQSAGHDMVSNQMFAEGLYMPHRNNCDSSSEAFVQVGSDSNKGFCIDKNENGAGTVEWHQARQHCADDGKRL